MLAGQAHCATAKPGLLAANTCALAQANNLCVEQHPLQKAQPRKYTPLQSRTGKLAKLRGLMP